MQDDHGGDKGNALMMLIGKPKGESKDGSKGDSFMKRRVGLAKAFRNAKSDESAADAMEAFVRACMGSSDENDEDKE